MGKIDISVKEESKEEDITKISRKDLEEKYKKQKRRINIQKTALAIIIIIIIGSILWNSWTDYSTTHTSQGDLGNQSNQTTRIDAAKSSLVIAITNFFTWAVNIDQPYFFKLMIFLGILYSFQIVISISFDFMEVFLLIFVLIKRIVMALIRWIFPKTSQISQTSQKI